MAIRAGSRYETSVVDYFRKTPNGTTYPVVLYKFDDLTSVRFTIHTYVVGETLTSLSYRYYQRPDLWWVIAEYNPEVTDFVHLSGGTLLRIPSV
jgi:hypothetical protein